MLKGIDPVLTADLLHLLASMGHGDDLVLVDANHPAQTIARATSYGKLIRLPGLSMERAARAILSVLPIDDFEPAPVRRIEVVGNPGDIPEVQRLVPDQAQQGWYAFQNYVEWLKSRGVTHTCAVVTKMKFDPAANVCDWMASNAGAADCANVIPHATTTSNETLLSMTAS